MEVFGSMLDNVRTFLSGKKTYLVALASILGAVIAWVGGTIDTATLLKTIVELILAMTLRAGIGKSA